MRIAKLNKIKSQTSKLEKRLEDSYRMLYSMKSILNGMMDMYNNLHRHNASQHTIDAFGCSAFCIEEWEHKIERQENHLRRSINMIRTKLEIDTDYKEMLIVKAMNIAKSKYDDKQRLVKV